MQKNEILQWLTLRHLPVLSAFNLLPIVEPRNGGIWQASHFALQHGLFTLNNIQVVQWLHKVRHGKTLHLALRNLWLLWNGWHLL